MLLYKRTQAYYVSVFGILAPRKPKYRRYVIFCYLVVLTFYLWLNRGLPQTIVLPLPTSLIHLKTTLFIICQHPHAEEVDLLLSHAKGFMFRCILVSLYSLFVQTFWVNYHLCWKGLSPCDGLSTSTIQNNSFTVERLFSELSTFLEELTVTSCQFLFFWWFQLSHHWQLKWKRQIIFWLFFLLICHPLFKLIGKAPWNWSQRCEKAFCAVKCALTSAATVLAHYDPKFPEELSVSVFLTFSINGWVLCSLTLRQLRLFDHSVFSELLINKCCEKYNTLK